MNTLQQKIFCAFCGYSSLCFLWLLFFVPFCGYSFKRARERARFARA